MTSEIAAPSEADLPTFDGSVVFNAPWQAQAFALICHLHAQGYFPWSEWAERLGVEIRMHGQPGEEDEAIYYHCWLRALEKLLVAKELIREEIYSERQAELRAAPPSSHVHAARREPIMIA